MAADFANAGHRRPPRCRLGSCMESAAASETALERFDRQNDWVLLVAALVVIPVILIEQSDTGEPWKTAAGIANWVIWSLFAIEAVVMLGFSPDRRGWARTHKLELAVV